VAADRIAESEERLTVEFPTTHSKTVTAYTVLYFQGLSLFSAPTSNLFAGSELGIAFLPVLVIVLGLDLENRGRMKVCRRKSTINSRLETYSLCFSRSSVTISWTGEVTHASRDEYTTQESKLCGFALVDVEVEDSDISIWRHLKP